MLTTINGQAGEKPLLPKKRPGYLLSTTQSEARVELDPTELRPKGVVDGGNSQYTGRWSALRGQKEYGSRATAQIPVWR